MKRLLQCLTISVALNAPALAAVPGLINYQGRLAQTGGAPVPDSTYSVVFTIYDEDVGGLIKWSETRSVTTVGGQFAIMLGAINPIVDSVFNGALRFMGTKIGTDPELVPRLRLTTVPYAFRASTVEGATFGTVSGHIDLQHSTTSNGNILKSGTLFLHDAGTDNTFLGAASGNLAMTGASNTGIGANALKANTSGTQNSALGEGALQLNTSGSNNTAVGADALHDASMADLNSAFGVQALGSNTAGTQNVAVGSRSCMQNLTGNYNSALGHEALKANKATSQNVAVGAFALNKHNTFDENTAIGFGAMQNDTAGVQCVAVGTLALGNASNGSGNVAIGYKALSSTWDWFNVAVGYEALRDLHFGGAYAGDVAVGSGADMTKHDGGECTAVGTGASTGNFTNATAIGAGATADADNKIRLGNNFVTVLECKVGLTVVSDSAEKENFNAVDGEEVLAKLGCLNVRSWNYKGQDPSSFRHYGPVAQEFYAAFGHDRVGSIGTPTTINSQDLEGVMLIAIQRLVAERNALRRDNEELQKRLGRLEEIVFR